MPKNFATGPQQVRGSPNFFLQIRGGPPRSKLSIFVEKQRWPACSKPRSIFEIDTKPVYKNADRPKRVSRVLPGLLLYCFSDNDSIRTAWFLKYPISRASGGLRTLHLAKKADSQKSTSVWSPRATPGILSQHVHESTREKKTLQPLLTLYFPISIWKRKLKK